MTETTDSSSAVPGSQDTSGGVAQRARTLEAQLRSVRAQARAQLVLTRIAVLVAAIAGATLIVGLADFLLRFPVALRVVFWLLGAGALGLGIWRVLVPAIRFNPSITEVALRMERIEAKRDPGIVGTLASALELARSESADVRQAAATTLERLDVRARATQILDPRKLFRAMAALAIVLAPLAAIGLARP